MPVVSGYLVAQNTLGVVIGCGGPARCTQSRSGSPSNCIPLRNPGQAFFACSTCLFWFQRSVLEALSDVVGSRGENEKESPHLFFALLLA